MSDESEIENKFMNEAKNSSPAVTITVRYGKAKKEDLIALGQSFGTVLHSMHLSDFDYSKVILVFKDFVTAKLLIDYINEVYSQDNINAAWFSFALDRKDLLLSLYQKNLGKQLFHSKMIESYSNKYINEQMDLMKLVLSPKAISELEELIQVNSSQSSADQKSFKETNSHFHNQSVEQERSIEYYNCKFFYDCILEEYLTQYTIKLCGFNNYNIIQVLSLCETDNSCFIEIEVRDNYCLKVKSNCNFLYIKAVGICSDLLFELLEEYKKSMFENNINPINYTTFIKEEYLTYSENIRPAV